jgi:YYY domain-containing protein
MFGNILTYWLVLQLIGLAALPTTAWLLRGLPDQGYAFAKPLGLLLIGWGAWLAAMLGLAPFGRGLLLAALLALAASGWLLVRLDAGERPWRALAGLARRKWPALLGYEVLLVVALLFAAWMRGYQPDPWGTERPMDFAFFNAIRRGGSFPPADPWLAGYSINYYYLGYLLMAALSLLGGVEPAVGYNLSLATLFALTALGVAGIVLSLVGLSERAGAAAGEQGNAAARTPGGWLKWACALVAVACVLLAGNQAAAAMVIAGSDRVVALDGRQLLAALGQGLGGAPTVTLPYATPPITDPGEWSETRYWERRPAPEGFSDWWPSRALWDDLWSDGQLTRRYAITEFPFFSFWLGDMHPHVMSLPFTLLAMALALGLLARPAPLTPQLNRGAWAEVGLAGVVLGGLYMINSWDLPTYLLLFAGALLLRAAREARGGPLPWRQIGVELALVAGAAYLLYLPFHLTFVSLVGGKEPLIPLPLLGRLSSILGVFADDKTRLSHFLVIFGLFLVPLLGFVLGQRAREAPLAPLGIAAGAWRGLGFWPLVLGVTFALGLSFGFPLLALLPLGLYACTLAYGQVAADNASAGVAFGLWLAALGCFICFGTELVYIRDVFEGWQPRFNTIFKFYYQTWLIWGTLAGFALWWVLARGGRLGAGLVLTLGLLLLAGALVYPALTAGRLPERGDWRGLQGTTPRERSEAGRAAIAWLRENAPPDAVVLEAVGGSYNGEGFAGVSAASGVATVIGWAGHESQWRGGDPEVLAELTPREQEVSLIYTTLDPGLARELLNKYRVTFVYLGDLERQSYGVDGEAKFNVLGDSVFQQGDVTIYRLR